VMVLPTARRSACEEAAAPRRAPPGRLRKRFFAVDATPPLPVSSVDHPAEDFMNVQEAIAIALDFERKVRDHYYRNAKAIQDAQGRKVFDTLATEEQGHVDYLEHCLAEWKKSGKVADIPLKSVLPKGSKWIAAEQRKVAARPGKRIAAVNEVDALKTALQYEKDAGAFYQKLVRELPPAHQPLFSKFLDIEDGHLELVQAQLDSVLGNGFWFDVMEIRLEAE
jgi:rubrerythrin